MISDLIFNEILKNSFVMNVKQLKFDFNHKSNFK